MTLHKDAIQTARETLVALRRQRVDVERQIAATETFIAAMTGRPPAGAHDPRPRISGTRVHKVPDEHKKLVLEALAGTEDKRDGMPRTEICELTGVNTGSLSRCLALLIAEEKVVQANPGVRRGTRFKIKTAEDSKVIKIHAGHGEVS